MTATANRENRTLGSQRPAGAGRGAAGTGSKGLPPVVWIGGLIVIAAAVVWWVTR